MKFHLIDIVECGDRRYEVNTIGMGGLAQFFDPMLKLRNDLFGINGCAETMIWEVDADNNRKDKILHCQRYRKMASAVKGHTKIVNWLKNGCIDFFNGDGFPQK
jgi:hypothetical protein